MMRRYAQPKYVYLVIFFIFLASYFTYQARAYISGPRIWIDSPKDGQTITSPIITISGRSKNIAWISLNGRPVFTDENGDWSEKLIVSSGLGIMTVKARDHFGHETEKIVRIIMPAQTNLE